VKRQWLLFISIVACPWIVSGDEYDDDRKAGLVLKRRAQRLERRLGQVSLSKIKSIIRQLKSWRSTDRLFAVEQLAIIGPRAVPLITKCLSSRNGYEVRFAVMALGRIRSSGSVAALIKLFNDKRCAEPDRYYAIGVIASIGTKESREFLWKHVFDHPQERVRRAAEVGLRRISASGYLAALTQALKTHEKALPALARLYKELTGRAEADKRKLIAWGKSQPTLTRSDDLHRVYGKGYVCLTDIKDEALIRGPLQRLVAFRSALVRWLQPGRRAQWTSQIRLYSDRSGFDQYGATHEFNFIYFTEFYYSGLLQEIVAFRGQQEELLGRRLQHEIGHDVFDHLVGDVPPWFAEGLCESFEVVQVKDERLQAPPINRDWIYTLGLAAKEDKIPKLQDLLDMDGAIFYGADSSYNYAAAWSFCHFLIVKRGQSGKKLLRKVLEAVKDYGLKKATRSFKGSNDVRILEKEWHAYIEGLVR
jgi:hypothetical protein